MNILRDGWKELTIALSLVFVLLLFINPFEIFGMPGAVQMAVVGIFTVLFMAFVAFVWQEHPEDERESHHAQLAGRVAFLAGAGTLAVGIVAEMLVSHRVDTWLSVSLAAMILSKVVSLSYLKRYC